MRSFLDFIQNFFTKISIKYIVWIFIFSFVLAVSMSLLLSKKFLHEHNSLKKTGVFSKAQVKTKITSKMLSEQDKREIFKRNIFNKDGEIPVEEEDSAFQVEEEKTQEILKTQLPIKLLGTIYSGSNKTGLAIIKQQKKVKSFFVGEQIFKDTYLLEIYKEKIIINRNSRKEYLEVDPFKIQRTKRKLAKLDVDKSKFAIKKKVSSYKEEGFERKDSEVTMSSEYRKRLLTQDFSKVLRDAKAEPYFEGGELSGFRLTRIKSGSIYQKSGFLNNDIIREVNGTQLVDTAQTINLLNSLREESEIDITIMRSGVPITINLQVK